MLSSASGESSRGGSGEGYDDRGSPLPYRELPQDYNPPELCKCRMKTNRWISWSNGNPGRRHHRCVRAKTPQDCKYYRWLDKECSDWYKVVLRDLRDVVWNLKDDFAWKDAVVRAKENQLVGLQIQVEEKNKELVDKEVVLQEKQEEVNAMGQQLVAMKQELEAKELTLLAMQSQLKSKNQCIDALVVFSFFIVVVLVVLLMQVK